MKKLSTRSIRKSKGEKKLSMLTCYDFQSAQALNESNVDMILVGDSLGNIVLGHETTIPVLLENMIMFGKAVRKGAQNKFLVVDLPFGSYHSLEQGLTNAVKLFQETNADALKLEGANPIELSLIERLTQIGVPVIGHVGLKPQHVKQKGGYFIEGKTHSQANSLLEDVRALQKVGVFSIVLECIVPEVAQNLTKDLKIITIGIGSGSETDAQVLVLNDLLGDSKQTPPSFCKPINNLYEQKLKSINQFVENTK